MREEEHKSQSSELYWSKIGASICTVKQAKYCICDCTRTSSRMWDRATETYAMPMAEPEVAIEDLEYQFSSRPTYSLPTASHLTASHQVLSLVSYVL